jgi:hypothetical protein
MGDLIDLITASSHCSEGHTCHACRREARESLDRLFTLAGQTIERDRLSGSVKRVTIERRREPGAIEPTYSIVEE